MIRLKNVSKFYYSKGVIASGFSKINVEFKMGEFVAITGESGSGKSTLLNVISGLDSYEEGEMYINGNETSHYTAKDFEDYRRKYIGNIFQNFNLVNSYTVYQNIELVLLLNGNKKKDIKQKVIDLIKTVDLFKFRNTKISKLSGGQKQRVAIARALAKDTPIILADEPTGNLDKNSAEGILNLLSNIAKDKLVIIVTHNYEQVEKYATRKIKMHDGKILEDDVLKETNEVVNSKTAKYDNITFLNKIRLGIRNAFNVIPKFILVFAVYLFITVAIITEYASFKHQEYVEGNYGFNQFFNDNSVKRIILKKTDKTAFTEEDYTALKKVKNVDQVIKNDLLNDLQVYLTDNNQINFNSTIHDIELFSGKPDMGRMPTNENEIIITGSKSQYYFSNNGEMLLDKDLIINDIDGAMNSNITLKVVGIKFDDGNNLNWIMSTYANKSVIDKLAFQINQKYSTIKVLFREQYYESQMYNPNYRIEASGYVPDGYAYIPESITYLCKDLKCIWQPLKVEVENIYYKDALNLTVLKEYNKKTMPGLLNINNFDEVNGTIYISINNYNALFNKPSYQSGVFVKDDRHIDETIKELKSMNYSTLKIKDTLQKNEGDKIMKIMKTIVTSILVISLFFISYFVIRVILKSRNTYFSIIRMLGATKKISKQLLVVELLAVSNLAFFMFLAAIYAINKYNPNIAFINQILIYLTNKDYILLYLILTLMSYFISLKFAKKLFKNSAISTLKEEV
ncbi:MAG: ABC transporter ATP-binding protein [Bacilli bacterium]